MGGGAGTGGGGAGAGGEVGAGRGAGGGQWPEGGVEKWQMYEHIDIMIIQHYYDYNLFDDFISLKLNAILSCFFGDNGPIFTIFLVIIANL